MSTPQKITYGCTALVGTNKVGDLIRRPDGYYEMVLGALAAFNGNGAYYELEESRRIFEGSGDLMRRIAGGNLRGEVGHPRFTEGMSERAWFSRVNDIYEPNACIHFNQVSLSYDTMSDKQNRPLVAVMGLVKPSGANERFLERQLDNPKENVCLSVRSFTNDRYQRGVLTKAITKVVTWDVVTEPGIDIANKYSVPTLESLSNEIREEDFDFDMATIRMMADEPTVAGIGMESAQSHAASLLKMVAEIEKPTSLYFDMRALKSNKW